METPAFIKKSPARLALAIFGSDSVRPTKAQAAAFRKYQTVSDPIVDELIAAIKKLPKGEGRAQFETALESGIEAVESPIPELVAFIEELENVPFWVDFDKLLLAQRTVSRIPMRTQVMLLTSIAFPVSYVSSRVNQVLVRAGDLDLKAPSRLAETNVWFCECALPGGMDRFGEGFKITARVRLIHGFIRSGMNSLDDWNYEEWGHPVNQSHYTVTLIPIMLSSLLTLLFGHLHTPRENDAVLHLLRYMAHVMGVHPALQITSFDELLRLIWLAIWSEFDPDASSPRLTKAALDAVPVLYGLPTTGPLAPAIRWAFRQIHADIATMVFGPFYRKAFGLPPLSPLVAVLPVIVGVNLLSDALRIITPGATRRRSIKGAAQRRKALKAMAERTQSNLAFTRDESKPRDIAVAANAPHLAVAN
ncbi:oxygenase MpaB family protein [Mycobacteroides sp. LB1]|uniref:oxygenase MpaB family protein n=1 Tax=Mycobacteroides sp. LB1 TaxID=2750814 RepID=UPI0015DF1377|nr:DUF2236 domain-containing protein [Mycobacteroides sp. LB1]